MTATWKSAITAHWAQLSMTWRHGSSCTGNSISRIIKTHAQRFMGLWRKIRIGRIRKRERLEREQRENEEGIRRQQAQRWFRLCMHHEPLSPPLYGTRDTLEDDMAKGYRRCDSLEECGNERIRERDKDKPRCKGEGCGLVLDAQSPMCAGCGLTRRGMAGRGMAFQHRG